MTRIGLVGNPARLQPFIELLSDSSEVILSGIHNRESAIHTFDNLLDQPALIFQDEDELISGSDAIIFAHFNSCEFNLAKKALKASRHIFLDPCDIIPSDILSEIHKLGEEAGVLYYLKHKPLNGDFQTRLETHYGSPEFLDVYRYVPAGKENRLKEIQMIIRQELLFVFSLNNHELKKHHLKTVPYSSWNPYIINVRFEFSNSSAANLTINFFTQNNSRFTELFYNENILRLNSGKSEIELINRQTGTFKVNRNSHNLENELRNSEEIERFISILNTKQFPAGFKQSGLSAHQHVWGIVRHISEVKVSQS